jgi:hypothetical protein
MSKVEEVQTQLEGDVEESKRVLITAGELRDNPGWYKIDGRVEDEADSWSAVRGPDDTWWWVAATHIFPPGGGDVRIDIGDQIKEQKTVDQLDEHYIELLQKLEEKKAKGDTNFHL